LEKQKLETTNHGVAQAFEVDQIKDNKLRDKTNVFNIFVSAFLADSDNLSYKLFIYNDNIS
jgi:hypothetical protein